jgi:hypothetical protein
MYDNLPSVTIVPSKTIVPSIFVMIVKLGKLSPSLTIITNSTEQSS